MPSLSESLKQPEDLKNHELSRFLSQLADPSLDKTSIALEAAVEEKLSSGIGKSDASGTLGSVGLKEIHSGAAKQKNSVSTYVLGEEQPLSSGSSTENIFLLTKSQKNYCLKDNAETISTVTAEPSAYSSDKLRSRCNIKVMNFTCGGSSCNRLAINILTPISCRERVLMIYCAWRVKASQL